MIRDEGKELLLSLPKLIVSDDKHNNSTFLIWVANIIANRLLVYWPIQDLEYVKGFFYGVKFKMLVDGIPLGFAIDRIGNCKVNAGNKVYEFNLREDSEIESLKNVLRGIQMGINAERNKE